MDTALSYIRVFILTQQLPACELPVCACLCRLHGRQAGTQTGVFRVDVGIRDQPSLLIAQSLRFCRLKETDMKSTGTFQIFITCLLFLLNGIFCGCSVHKSTLEKDLPGSDYTFQNKFEHTAPPVDRWWEYFNDPQLNNLMDEMFQSNLDIEQAFARWRRFEAECIVVDAGRKPLINLSFSGGREQTPTVKSSTGPTRNNKFQLAAAGSFELDLWGKLKERERASIWELLATESDIRTLYISLSAEVADLYFKIIEIKHLIKLLSQTIESYEQSLDVTKNRYLQGLNSIRDVYQAEQSLASTLTQRPQLQESLILAEYALSLLLGRYPEINISGKVDTLPQAPLPLPVDMPSTLLKNRPDIQASMARLRATDARLGAAVADRFPSFNLSAKIGYGSTRVAELIKPDNLLWNFVGDLVQPLIDGGRRKAEIRSKRAQYEELIYKYKSDVLTAFKEVEDALVKNKKVETRLKLEEDSVLASAGLLEITREQYVQGIMDYLPLLTAQQAYYRSQTELVSTRRELISNRIELARVLGGKWSEKMVKERLEKE